jgi:hypothetical protein
MELHFGPQEPLDTEALQKEQKHRFWAVSSIFWSLFINTPFINQSLKTVYKCPGNYKQSPRTPLSCEMPSARRRIRWWTRNIVEEITIRSGIWRAKKDSKQSNQYPNSFEYSRKLQRSGGLPAKISSDENESRLK